MVLSSWWKPLWEFTRFIWALVGRQPRNQANWLELWLLLLLLYPFISTEGCESTENWLLPSTPTIAIDIITQPVIWYSFCHPTERGKLSRPRHCSKGAKLVPKAVHRSSCRDKHNRTLCDSKLGPLTPQSDTLTTRLLWPTAR